MGSLQAFETGRLARKTSCSPYPAVSRPMPTRARWGAKRQASPRITPETVAIMPAALTAYCPPNHRGP